MLTGKQFEILIVKLAGVVTFDLLPILQGDGARFELLAVSAIRMLVVLLLFGCGLLDPTGVFIGIMSVWVLSKDFFLQFFHGIKAGAIWIPCHSSVNAGMHVIQTWIFCLAKQVLDFSKLIDD